MANTKSAQQHVLINKRNRKRNLSQRDKVKNLIKEIDKLNNPSKEDLQNLLNNIYSTLDKVSHQAISPARASRLKSRASKKIKALSIA